MHFTLCTSLDDVIFTQWDSIDWQGDSGCVSSYVFRKFQLFLEKRGIPGYVYRFILIMFSHITKLSFWLNIYFHIDFKSYFVLYVTNPVYNNFENQCWVLILLLGNTQWIIYVLFSWNFWATSACTLLCFKEEKGFINISCWKYCCLPA